MPTGFFTHDLCHSYQQGPDSPESPERIDAIEDRMIAMGLSRVVTVLPSAPASMEDVLRAHDKSYVQELEQASREAQRTGEKQISEDTFINALSFEAALKSAGAALRRYDKSVPEPFEMPLLVYVRPDTMRDVILRTAFV